MAMRAMTSTTACAMQPEKRERDPKANEWSRKKRAERKAAGTCVNGVAARARGIRCTRCYLVWRFTAEVAREMAEYQAAPLCNPHRAEHAA